MYLGTLYFLSFDLYTPAFKIFSITVQTQTFILIGPSHAIMCWPDADTLKQPWC